MNLLINLTITLIIHRKVQIKQKQTDMQHVINLCLMGAPHEQYEAINMVLLSIFYQSLNNHKYVLIYYFSAFQQMTLRK